MKKMENIPSIIWKDIYKFNINSQKEVNGKLIHGPKLYLRGETNSQINEGHAFIIYLIFKIIKQPLIKRNLPKFEDSIMIKTICEVSKEFEANKEENITVDYECIGEDKDINLNNYLFDNIVVENDFSSNLKNLILDKNLSQLNIGPTLEFTMDTIKNQTSNDYNFDFSINGKIDDSNIKDLEIIHKFKMNEINEPSYCSLKIERQNFANLNCVLNVKAYKKMKYFTFNTTKIEYNNEFNISFINLNKVFLINKFKSNNIGLIIGLIIEAILIIFCILVLIYIIFNCKKKSNKKPKNLSSSNKEKKYSITSINEGEKIMSVNFVSIGKNDISNYSLPCKNSDSFELLEARLNHDYPDLKKYQTLYMVNTRKIDKLKSLEENNIKTNDIINVFILDTEKNDNNLIND